MNKAGLKKLATGLGLTFAAGINETQMRDQIAAHLATLGGTVTAVVEAAFVDAGAPLNGADPDSHFASLFAGHTPPPPSGDTITFNGVEYKVSKTHNRPVRLTHNVRILGMRATGAKNKGGDIILVEGVNLDSGEEITFSTNQAYIDGAIETFKQLGTKKGDIPSIPVGGYVLKVAFNQALEGKSTFIVEDATIIQKVETQFGTAFVGSYRSRTQDASGAVNNSYKKQVYLTHTATYLDFAGFSAAVDSQAVALLDEKRLTSAQKAGAVTESQGLAGLKVKKASLTEVSSYAKQLQTEFPELTAIEALRMSQEYFK